MSPIASAVGPLVDVLALAILLFSIREIWRKGFPGFHDLRESLIAVMGLYWFVSALDLIRNFDTSTTYIEFYAIAGASSVVWGVLLLSFSAYVIYVRPRESTLQGRVEALFHSRFWPHGVALSSITVYISFMTLYLLQAHPFNIVHVENLAGATLKAPTFGITFLLLAGGLLVFVIAYPVQSLLRSRSKVADKEVRRAMVIIPISWTLIGNAILIFNGFLVLRGYDVIPFGFLIRALVIGWASTVFRKASVVDFFFSHSMVGPSSEASSTFPFSSKMRPSGNPLPAGPTLLEFDASVDLESAIEDYAKEQISAGRLFFVYTPAGSPLAHTHRTIAGAHFIIQSRNELPWSSATKGATPDPRRMVISGGDLNLILNVIAKTMEMEASIPKTFVFDSLSDQIISFGLERTYGFVKQLQEIVYELGANCIMLMIKNGHDERTINAIESLFSTILSLDADSLKIMKLRTQSSASSP